MRADRRLLGLLALIALACFGEVAPDELAGVWRSADATSETRLILRPDGSFEETHRGGSAGETIHGTWSLERSGRRPYVMLRQLGGTPDKPVVASGGHTIKRWMGRITLEDDPDQDREFVKVSGD